MSSHRRFATKGRTLEHLRGSLQSARIAPLARISQAQWRRGAQSWAAQIERELGPPPWIVRSSCAREDSAHASHAGEFLSIPNVLGEALVRAVDDVFASYGPCQADDEVLIQPMLHGVVRAGVAFSHDPGTCAPYRIINWTEGPDTSAATAGRPVRTWQQAAHSRRTTPPGLAGVIALLDELLAYFDGAPLDCEFAQTSDTDGEILWLLQVRPLILPRPPETAERQAGRLHQIEAKVARGMQPHPFLMGNRTVYGVMPDWNPAEIIGIRPKPLALSLYRDLVTDAIWAYQRHNYGYRNLRSFPLMQPLFGLPYIDVRLSFNSFIPADLDEPLASRLVDHYIERLLAEPALHDKVEFEIVYSCYTLDLPQRMKRLAEAGFSPREREQLAASLRRLTNRIVHPQDGLWRADAAKLDVLQRRRESLFGSTADPLERVYWLLEDAKRYGTLPFAGLARAGFIAIQMLRSLVGVGVFSRADYDAFLASVSTVSGQLARDRGTLDRTTFLARYGHLRPGTYDILSPRYDEAPDLYFDWNRSSGAAASAAPPYSITLPQMRELVKLLESHELEADPVGLLEFLQAGIELREQAKFAFTRNLSDALALVARIGEQHGFTPEDMAYCDISAIKELHVAALDPVAVLRHSIEQGRERHAETLAVALPPVIAEPADVWAFEWPASAPNFITQKQVTAPVTDCSELQRLAGRIVCIPNADPGFDWLFAYPIAGLVTAWGGSNSHMAIRAGELGLPAVIGAGEALYRCWAGAQRLHLDCAGHRVEVLA
ncbi:MAG: hypothetical protein KJZ96_02370 [Rhodocyclaceae bacterium]|jgi:hypothetical protein|nr:hypothetical protein [Rhodocyclaceae bacterium]